MRVCSTTLAGPGCGPLILDALRSAHDAVDDHLIILSGIGREELGALCDAIGKEMHERRPFQTVVYQWADDCAAARNFALMTAANLGYDWAVTLDADERLKGGAELRQAIESSDRQVLFVAAADGSYSKDRAFRLPAGARWHGRAHEYFPSMDSRDLVAGVSFDELAKTPDQLRRKFEKVVELLTLQIADEPHASRWHYYLADAYEGLGRNNDAIVSFRTCANTPGWCEERAWACYRAADLLSREKLYQGAIEICAQGLGIHPGTGELAWLAGFCSYQLGCYEDAVHWGRMAITSSQFGGYPKVENRLGFRHPPALYELPWQLLHFAYRKLGMTSAAQMADMKCTAAQKVRESGKVSRSNWDRPGL